jgi:hypothetical protein
MKAGTLELAMWLEESGLFACFLGYGVRTFQEETGRSLDLPRRFPHGPTGLLDQAEYLSRVFLSLLRSLGKAGSRPKNFEIILRESSIYDHAFNLPNYVDVLVQPVLGNMRTLLLDLNAEYKPAYVNVNNVPTECPNYLLRTFLSRLLELENLRLNFRFFRGEDDSSLLSWLSKPVSATTPNTTAATSLPESPQPIEFTKLRQLEIGMITVEPRILLDIIQKHRATLRSISLHKVSLLQTDPTKSSRDNPWAKFFGQLSKLDLKLTSMNMSLLSQKSESTNPFRPVTFKDSRDLKRREWGGTDVQSCLRDFIANLVINGPDHDTESSHTPESEEWNSDGKSSYLNINIHNLLTSKQIPCTMLTTKTRTKTRTKMSSRGIRLGGAMEDGNMLVWFAFSCSNKKYQSCCWLAPHVLPPKSIKATLWGTFFGD